MLGISAVPGVLLVLVAMLPMPESPRWLIRRDAATRRARRCARSRPDADVDARLDDDRARRCAEDADQASWGEVFGQRCAQPLMIGVGLAMFQQITGINAIIYYADEIFAAAGFATPAGQAAATTWAIGVVNVLATFIAIAYVDRFGRRPLLLAGLVGMSRQPTAVGIGFLSLDESATDAARARAWPASSRSSASWCSSPRSPSRSDRSSGP